MRFPPRAPARRSRMGQTRAQTTGSACRARGTGARNVARAPASNSIRRRPPVAIHHRAGIGAWRGSVVAGVPLNKADLREPPDFLAQPTLDRPDRRRITARGWDKAPGDSRSCRMRDTARHRLRPHTSGLTRDQGSGSSSSSTRSGTRRQMSTERPRRTRPGPAPSRLRRAGRRPAPTRRWAPLDCRSPDRAATTGNTSAGVTGACRTLSIVQEAHVCLGSSAGRSAMASSIRRTSRSLTTSSWAHRLKRRAKANVGLNVNPRSRRSPPRRA